MKAFTNMPKTDLIKSRPDSAQRISDRVNKNIAWILFYDGPLKGKYQSIEYKEGAKVRIKVIDSPVTYLYGADILNPDGEEITHVYYIGIV